MSAQGTAILLLAAGASKRLGQAKQLVRKGGRSLLRRAAEEAIAARCGPVLVVLGARAEDMQAELAGLPLAVCTNEQWEEGLASSIRAGLQAVLSREPPPARIMIMLCDQPAVDRTVLAHLLALHHESGCVATACSIDGRAQVPAIFEAELFGRLLALHGDEGARGLLRSPELAVALMEFPAAGLDIDTSEDLRGPHGDSA